MNVMPCGQRPPRVECSSLYGEGEAQPLRVTSLRFDDLAELAAL